MRITPVFILVLLVTCSQMILGQKGSKSNGASYMRNNFDTGKASRKNGLNTDQQSRFTGKPSKPNGYESGKPSRPNGYESGKPSKPNGYDFGKPSKPNGYESGKPSRQTSWFTGNSDYLNMYKRYQQDKPKNEEMVICKEPFVGWNKTCYLFSDIVATKNMAQKFCEVYEADLTTIEHEKENLWLLWQLNTGKKNYNQHSQFERTQPVYYNIYWTDGSWNHSNWTWNASHEIMNYSAWGPEQPKNLKDVMKHDGIELTVDASESGPQCMALATLKELQNNFTWVSIPCDTKEEFRFICKKHHRRCPWKNRDKPEGETNGRQYPGTRPPRTQKPTTAKPVEPTEANWGWDNMEEWNFGFQG